MALSELASGYDCVLLDLDGCVWVGEEATPRAAEALLELRGAGTAIAFVTNDARHSPEEFVAKLWRLGLQASLDEVVTVGSALQHRLAGEHPDGATAFVIGAQPIVDHVAVAGLRVLNGTEHAPTAQVVVVAGHDDFDYAELRTAVQAVLAGAELLATSRDATFPMPDGPWPGTGAIVAAVEAATGRTAACVGKPDAELARTALERCGGGRALLIGDRVDVDLACAHAAGIDGAVVLTGATATREQAEESAQPAVAVGATLADLLLA